MKKILVTGACGYLGAWLSKYLAKEGYRVTAFDSFDPSRYSQWTSLMEEVIIGDIRDKRTLSNLTEKQFDVAIHLISLDHHKSEDNPNRVASINVMPTWNLLDKLTKNGLGKFIYFSTVHIYGKLPKKIIREDTTPAPINTYGLTHLLSEDICNYFNVKTETNCINVRLSNSYGSPVFNENDCWWLVINDLCKTAFKEHKIELFSDGSPQRDFIHLSDICRLIKIIIESEEDFNENIFHIASGNTISILESAHIVKKVYYERYKKEIPIYLVESSISSCDYKIENIEKSIIDIGKIKHLGFIPKMELEKGIHEIFNFFHF